jgi:hypothetical protein
VRTIQLIIAFAGMCVICTSAGAQVAQVRDSEGVRLITLSSFVVRGPLLTLGRPVADLGGLHDTAAKEFDSKNPGLNGLFLSHDRIAVADGVHLKFFDPRGAILGMVGRSGGGPGEFRQISQLCESIDAEILAFEANGHRVTVFDSLGKLIRTLSIPGISVGAGCFADGSFLFRSTEESQGAVGARPTSSYSRMSSAGEIRRGPGRIITSGPAYGIPAVTIGIVVRGTKVYVADPVGAEVREFTGDGQLDEVIRSRAPRERFTEADLKTEIEKLVPGGARANPDVARELETQPHRAWWPAFAQLMVDPAGRLWVEDYFNRQPRGWNVFDARGNPLGRILLDQLAKGPGDIVGIGGDAVVVRWYDSDGAAHLTWRQVPTFSHRD